MGFAHLANYFAPMPEQGKEWHSLYAVKLELVCGCAGQVIS